MADKEIPAALSALFEAVQAYQDTQEGLGRVRAVAESVWGEDWRARLPSIVNDAPESILPQIKTNVQRALTYDKAASVWGEASRLADPRRPIDAEQVKKQLPDFQKWLNIFGKAGADLYAKLAKKIQDVEASASKGAVTTANPYGLTIEQLWNFDHFMRLKTYYDATISRTSARCVHLGGLEISQYPYYGYILDLLDEILTFGMEILTPPYSAIIRDRYKGGLPALKKLLSEFQKEFEANAPPEMMGDNGESLDEIKNRLGNLADAGETEENIGPAPDGFKAPTAEEMAEQKRIADAAAASGTVQRPILPSMAEETT